MKIPNALSVIMLAATGVGALAADAPVRKPGADAFADRCADRQLASPDAFGFAAGAGVAAPGDRGLGLEYSGAYGSRGGSSQAHGVKAQASFGVLPCFEVGPSLFVGWSRSSDRTAATSMRTLGSGAGVEAKYKILEAPGFGVTAVIEPTYAWSRTRLSDFATPSFQAGGAPVAGVTAKLLVEKTLIAKRLFATANLEQGASFSKDNGVDVVTGSGSGWSRSSSLTIRAALALKAASWGPEDEGGVFLGLDASHQRVHEGAFLNRRPGWAWFAGPNLLVQIDSKLSLNAAWSSQLRGRAAGQGAGGLDLADFNRHVAKLKLGVALD